METQFIEALKVIDVYKLTRARIEGDYTHPIKKEQERLFNMTKSAENCCIEYLAGTDPNLTEINSFLESSGIELNEKVLLKLQF